MADQKTGITIALVDDSMPLRRLLSVYLTAQGFTVMYEADHGQQLLDALTDATTLPDMCLLDANMPVMNGYETARRLKSDYASIKIMGYSFFDSCDSSSTMLQCGAHAVISKDASADELRDALISLYETSQAEGYFCTSDFHYKALSVSDRVSSIY